MKMPLTIVLIVLFIAAPAVYAATADDILGTWNNEEKDAKIEIFKCSDKYCGKIVWLKIPDYPEGSKDGAPGTPKLDHKNPDPILKKAPVIGLEIVKGFVFAGDSK